MGNILNVVAFPLCLIANSVRIKEKLGVCSHRKYIIAVKNKCRLVKAKSHSRLGKQKISIKFKLVYFT